MDTSTYFFNAEAPVLGVLIIILACIFYAEKSNNNFLVKFFKYVPGLLLCYFVPSILMLTVFSYSSY